MKSKGIKENSFSLSRIKGRKGHFNGNYLDFFQFHYSKFEWNFNKIPDNGIENIHMITIKMSF